jgi:hypothetical protein
MLINEFLLGYRRTPPVVYPTNATNGVPFTWSISGGLPNEGFWVTTTAPSKPAFGSSSSPYGYLNANGEANFTGGDYSPDVGTFTVTIYFQFSNTVTKTIVVNAGPAPTVTFPTTQVAAYNFSWSISGGLAGNAYWITTTAPSHLTYGSKASPYGYLDGNGNATISNFSMAGDIGTYSVTFYFYNGSSVTKSITLTRTPITVTQNFRSVTNNGNIFVAVGTGGVIFQSTDKGVTWIKKDNGYTNDLKHVVNNGANFVAAGDNGWVLYSTDNGSTWTRNMNVLSTPNVLYGLDFVAGCFTLTGGSSSPQYKAIFYTDLSSGYVGNGNTSGLSASGMVGYVQNGSFYYTAEKGGLMHYRSKPPNDTDVIASGWSVVPRDASASLAAFNSVATGGSYLYGVGEHVGSIRGGLATGTQYPYAYSGASITLNKIKYLNSQFLAVGGGSLLYWSGASTPSITRADISGYTLYGVAGSSTTNYVVVGDSGTLLYASAYTGAWAAGGTYI